MQIPDKPISNAAKHKTTKGIWLAIVVLFHGCAGGLYTDGYETYLDANGEVVRAYPAPYDQTVQAGIAALADVGGSFSNGAVKGHESIVQARTSDGSPIRLRFVREGRNLTVVRVRTGLLGYTNQEYSNQFHVYLAARIKQIGGLTARPLKPSGSGKADSALASASNPTPRTAVTAAQPDVPEATIPPQPKATPAAESPIPAPSATSSPKADNLEKSPPSESDHDETTEIARLIDPAQSKPDYIIFFERDSNITPPDALAILDQAARRLQANKDTIVAIRGYADSDEDPAQLHLVSESRALAVKSYLIGRGIAPGRIRTTWHGSNFSRSAIRSKSHHRRVEIRLLRGL